MGKREGVGFNIPGFVVVFRPFLIFLGILILLLSGCGQSNPSAANLDKNLEQLPDTDGDGTPDPVDLCPNTDSNGPIPTGVLCEGCVGDDPAIYGTIHGCNASQIVECRPGPNKREIEFGLRPNTQKTFEQCKGWAKRCNCDCVASGTDTDGDGTTDCIDICPLDPNKQSDVGVCGCNVPDDDTDGDGIPDCNDNCPDDPDKTEPGTCGCGIPDTPNCGDNCPDDPDKTDPGQCGCGNPDTDSDGDGTADCVDECPEDGDKTDPGACGCGVPDTDSDGDGTPDCDDGCPDDGGKTEPGVCGCGVSDVDSDGDGTPNCVDGCPNDTAKLSPGVCGCGVPDTDSDGDGNPDCSDGCPNDPGKTSPGACGCGTADTDSDNDGTPDCSDQCPNDAGKINPGTCGCGTADTDSDGDGTPDCQDSCPTDSAKTNPGACGCGTADTDSDGDGTPDCNDQCPNDASKTKPGACGCGNADTDSDGDGTPDCNDGCPSDPNKVGPGQCGCGVEDTPGCGDECPDDPDKTAPGVCGCGTPDTDSDSDGTADCNDSCPADPNKTEPGTCGCGTPETDSDGDGSLDCEDGCPSDAAKTAPGVCGCGVPDDDGDGDGTADCNDDCPTDPDKTAPGACGCGVADLDSDGDGAPDCTDGCPNDNDKTAPGACGCGTPDTDSDGDGNPDCTDGCPGDPDKTSPGACGCGTPDTDSDGDGTPDCNDDCPSDGNKTEPGVCGCGTSDADSDGDGNPDCTDGCPGDSGKTEPGICGCGTPDTDSDGDGTPDCNDGCPDDPNKTDPGQGGCGVEEPVSGTVTEGSELVLDLGEASFTVPAGALPAGVDITLTEKQVENTDFVPGTGETPITEVYVVSFSQSVDAQTQMTLSVQIPAEITTHFYGYLKIVGAEPFAEFTGDAPWSLQIGSFDEASSTLGVSLLTTATELSLVVVHRPSPTALKLESREGFFAALLPKLNPWKSARQAIQLLHRTAIFIQEKLIPTSFALELTVRFLENWQNYGWVVICPLPEDTERCGQAGLDNTALIFHTKVQDLLTFGFDSGAVELTTRGDIERTGLPFGTFETGQPLPEGGDPQKQKFLLAHFVPDGSLPSGTIANYRPIDGKINMTPEALTLVAPDDVVIHELTHAAQIFELFPLQIARERWVVEGGAVAIEVANNVPDLMARQEFRRGIWRDWAESLDADDPSSTAYQTAEFWLDLADGSMDYLHPLYENLKAQKGTFEGASGGYIALNPALQVTFRVSNPDLLADIYIELIKARDMDPGYPYCQPLPCHLDSECIVPPLPIDAMSAICFDIEIVEETCPGGEEPTEKPEPHLSIIENFATSPSVIVEMMVNGEVYNEGESLLVDLEERVWAIRPDFFGNFAKFTFEVTSVGELVCPSACGNEILEVDEECDDGIETATCDDDCTFPVCGDGICNEPAGEDEVSCPADCCVPIDCTIFGEPTPPWFGADYCTDDSGISLQVFFGLGDEMCFDVSITEFEPCPIALSRPNMMDPDVINGSFNAYTFSVDGEEMPTPPGVYDFPITNEDVLTVFRDFSEPTVPDKEEYLILRTKKDDFNFRSCDDSVYPPPDDLNDPSCVERRCVCYDDGRGNADGCRWQVERQIDYVCCNGYNDFAQYIGQNRCYIDVLGTDPPRCGYNIISWPAWLEWSADHPDQPVWSHDKICYGPEMDWQDPPHSFEKLRNCPAEINYYCLPYTGERYDGCHYR